jgi:hypothetical protein
VRSTSYTLAVRDYFTIPTIILAQQAPMRFSIMRRQGSGKTTSNLAFGGTRRHWPIGIEGRAEIALKNKSHFLVYYVL